MADRECGGLENVVVDLATRFRGVMAWEWGGRFGTALAVFPAEQKCQVLETLQASLVSPWDSKRLQEAPDTVHKIAQNLGGILPGQLLLLTDPSEPALVFCAWWPWGNGQRISICLAPWTHGVAEDEAANLIAIFRRQFGV